MNGAQQRQHRRATDTLAQVITETQGAVVERFEDMEASFAALHDRIREHRVLIHQLQTQARICRAEDRLIAWELFYGRGFWERLRWLVTGR